MISLPATAPARRRIPRHVRRIGSLVGGLLVVLLAGCSPDPATATVTVADRSFTVEIAHSRQQQRHGLSERDRLPEGHGMLFEFDGDSTQQVWMPGMNFALDIAWIADGRVLGVRTLQPCREPEESDCPKWTSPAPVDALLEVPAGSLDGVQTGAPVRIDHELS